MSPAAEPGSGRDAPWGDGRCQRSPSFWRTSTARRWTRSRSATARPTTSLWSTPSCPRAATARAATRATASTRTRAGPTSSTSAPSRSPTRWHGSTTSSRPCGACPSRSVRPSPWARPGWWAAVYLLERHGCWEGRARQWTTCRGGGSTWWSTRLAAPRRRPRSTSRRCVSRERARVGAREA